MALSEEIKGISVKIGANTTELSNALKGINSEIRGTGKELSEINKLLKFDPSNTELLKQKQSALKDQIADTKTKLDALKQAQQEAKNMFANGEIDQGAYEKLKRNVVQTEQSLTKYKGELKDTNKALITHGDTLSKVGDKLKTVASVTAKVGEAAAAVTAVVGAAAIAIGKEVVQNYAEYEQLIGGVETLFGESAGKVEEYANNAFKTTGLSANEYMETVTSFSASLLQSLDGDTVAAADKADQALRDMSDNANKMGTDMESIQNAYQGFAKQNYTMLDNLKLGYGGTKSEMERLLADAEKISGVKYDISSYSDVIDAIHVMQTEMGITGTTALEAEKTVSGSLNTLKASYQNLITGLASPDADVTQLVDNVVESFENLANNVVPIIERLVDSLPVAFTALSEAATRLLPTLITTATELLAQLISAIINALPQLIPVAVQSVQTIVDTLIDNLPLLVSAAIQIIIALAIGLIQALPELIAKIPEIIVAIVNTFAAYDWGSIGSNLMEGIKNGILNAWEKVKSAITSVANKIKEKFEDIFDINSPSRWASEVIGKNLDLGLAQGLEKYKEIAINTASAVGGAVANAMTYGTAADYGSTRSSAINVTTPVYLDGKIIATVVNNRLGAIL